MKVSKSLLIALTLIINSLAMATEIKGGWYRLSDDHSIRELVKPFYNSSGKLISIKIWTDEYIEKGYAHESSHVQRRRFECKGNSCVQKYPHTTHGGQINITSRASYRSVFPFANPTMEENWNEYRLLKSLSDEAIDKLVAEVEEF